MRTCQRANVSLIDKPRPTITTRRLPFADLSPDDLELICLRLIKTMGYLRPEHYAGTGDGGGDIVAYKQIDRGEEPWYFQCKRYEKISAADLIPEIDKIHDLEARPAGIALKKRPAQL